MPEKQTIPIDGIPVDNLSRAEALGALSGLIVSRGPHMVVFVNAEAVVLARHNKEFRDALLRASLRLVDGAGMSFAATFKGSTFKGNLNGTDLYPYICRLLEEKKGSAYLLGGKPGIAERTGLWIAQNYPHVQVVGTHDGYFSKQEESDVIKTIQRAKPDVLLVGMGSPYQEIWINNNLQQTGATVAVGVGGLFDYYSDTVKRAPHWIRKIGFEWLWRILREPRRWWRIMRLFEFLWIVLIG